MGQVLFDAVQTPVQGNNVASPSGTHTPVGTPTVALVMVHYGFNGRTISSVTYGGTSMALEQSGVNGQDSVAIYSLPNPAAGSQTVQVNFSGAEYSVLYAMTFTESDTTDAVAASHGTSGTGTSATPSLTCTSDTDELIVDAMSHANSTGSVDAGQTQRVNTSAFGVINAYSSTQVGGSPNGVMSWSMGGSANYGYAAVSLKAGGGGGGNTTGFGQFIQVTP